MSRPSHIDETPNWPAFYRRLCRSGPAALTGVPSELRPILQSYASTSDLFWSDDLYATLFIRWDDPSKAIEEAVQVFTENVRLEFMAPPLCWCNSWLSSPDTGEDLPLMDCVNLIKFRLTERMVKSLLCAAQSSYLPSTKVRVLTPVGE